MQSLDNEIQWKRINTWSNRDELSVGKPWDIRRTDISSVHSKVARSQRNNPSRSATVDASAMVENAARSLSDTDGYRER